ncbi:MAG: serine/threonine protein kinase [Thermoproteota archaeon]|nr:serine/threonine protein kinase [Thermoproteota archaeon]
MTLSQRNVSFLDEELDIRSPRLIPIISYPHFSESEYKDRIIEMESLGITSIILGGKTIVNGAHIAGKGCVGIVVKAKSRGEVCALKIRRTDANRETMDNEVHLHKMANSACVGPSLEEHTKNLILMEFVAGQSIIDWVVSNNVTESKMWTLAVAILEQCFSLDIAGLDHGELSRLTRHVIVSDRPYIIDFESASTTRKTCNVTAAAQSLLLYGIVANKVKTIMCNTDKERLIQALRTYKHFHTRANFDAILGSLLT